MKSQDPLIKWFLSHCHQRKLPSKYLLASSARGSERLHYLIFGQAYLTAHDQNERPRILEQLNAGSFVGENFLFFQNVQLLPDYSWTIRLKSAENRVASISNLEFLKLCRQNPELWNRLAHRQQVRLHQMMQRLTQHLFLDVTERIIDRLSALARAKEAVTHPQGIQIHSTRQELSQWAGCSRETVGRALRILQDQQRLNAHGKTILLYPQCAAQSEL